MNLDMLSDWGEHWRPAEELAGHGAWTGLAERYGRGQDPDSLKYHMTRGLLEELVYAAGGVEAELNRLVAAIEEARAWAAQVGDPASRYAAPSLSEAFYAFSNMLTWIRAVQERSERRAATGDARQAGLLPALAPGDLADQVALALDRFAGRVSEARTLANYALHAGALSGPSTAFGSLTSDGRFVVALPDQVTSRVTTWQEFTFDQGRDMLTYGEELMRAVEEYVDEVLLSTTAEH